ncbi:MAG: SDR family NAD(P)-dependent oxidoreductase, partial [Methylocystis sp.]|nr:SDR family NAD(P)-dependent oxidoreductase [Methylocystis sp.]
MREAQRILITGASSGIGRALALGYAAPRRSLLLLGRDAARLELVVQECRAKGAAVETSIVDVRDRLAMAACVEQAGERQSIDLLIANAGVATGLSPGQFVEDPQAVRGAFAINVLGEHHEDVSNAFARSANHAAWDQVSHADGVTGSPLLD